LADPATAPGGGRATRRSRVVRFGQPDLLAGKPSGVRGGWLGGRPADRRRGGWTDLRRRGRRYRRQAGDRADRRGGTTARGVVAGGRHGGDLRTGTAFRPAG